MSVRTWISYKKNLYSLNYKDVGTLPTMPYNGLVLDKNKLLKPQYLL